MTEVRKSISAAQRKRDPKAGPHGSFPLDPEHLKAAWDLAGHAANPEAVRARVKAYAKAHGMMGHLPKDAQDGEGEKVKKAKTSDVRDLLQTAYHMSAPHSWEREHLVRTAARKGLTQHLPAEAHTDLHEYGIRHNHPNMNDGILPRLNHENEGDIQEDPDDPAYPMMHEHVITKAFNPKVISGVIVKSWAEDGTDDQIIEGWMSTPDKDIEKDITEPEAFAGGPLRDYFARSAPLSLEHGTNSLPAGHLQKAAIIRDGKVIETAAHPSDPADFAHLPTSGSGVWVRSRITEEPAKSAVRKGNVGGMSFIGNFTHYTPLPGGGKRYHKIDPLIESTVAAYPVNPKAAFSRVQKALGLSDHDVQETDMEDFDFDAFMQEAADRAAEKRRAEEAANQQVQKAVTPEMLGDALTSLMEKIDALIDSKVQKAVPARGEGVGRKGAVPSSERSPEAELEANPVEYLVKKSNSGEELTQREKEIAGRLWNAALAQNMAYAPEADEE